VGPPFPGKEYGAGRKPPYNSSHQTVISTTDEKEARTMGTIGKRILTVAIGLLLAAGVPYMAATTVHADPGSGSGRECSCGEKSDCGGHKGKHEGKHEGMQCMKGGQMPCKQMAGGPPMMEGMAGHVEETRGTIAKLRALEATMETLTSKDDAAAFRAASLEHSKLLTDLQASHLKHMEGMMDRK
jgi:hypothetical protein